VSKRRLILANNPLLSGPPLAEREKGGIPYREIKVELIDADPKQPRLHFDEEKLQELAHSIQTYGVLSPILVRKGELPGRFIVVAGERRLRAARIIGLTSVPAIVDQGDDKSGERTLAMQLVENLQRADLATLERAQAIGALRDNYSLSIRDIGERLGMSKSAVQRSLEILELPDDLLNALKEGAAESKVLLLAKIEDEEIRASYLKDLEVLTRSQLQKDLEKTKERVKLNGQGSVAPEDLRISEEIQRALGLKVRLSRSEEGGERGRLTIEFYSEDDLQELFRKLVGEGM
jgi:ParB family transcriptional regulator, chromosome partitioning protein